MSEIRQVNKTSAKRRQLCRRSHKLPRFDFGMISLAFNWIRSISNFRSDTSCHFAGVVSDYIQIILFISTLPSEHNEWGWRVY